MLLERDRELSLLTDLHAGVESAGGRVVLVRGEAGIGKSALVGGFLEGIADESHVLIGTCDDLLTPQAFGPFWDVARSESSLRASLEKGDRRAVMEDLLEILSRGLRTTVLVIEDTHWADEATLDAIRYLGRRIARANGLLILTYRDGEVDYDHPLRQVIGELAPNDLVRIRLDNLSSQAVADLVGDTDLDPAEVVSLTAGNPLFVTEIIASGVERVPLSVTDTVLSRAAKLSPVARQVLDVVSVMPGEAERRFVEQLVDPTQEQITECTRQGLLDVREDFIGFQHELARRAVESALSRSDRKNINASVLAELGGRGDLARLVHHAVEANDPRAIIEFSPKAARAAMAIASYREAAAHFRTLEPYLEQVTDKNRAHIVDDWAHNEFYLDHIEAHDILAKAISLHRANNDHLAVAQALIFATRTNELNGNPQAAEFSISEAISILESYPPSEGLALAMSQRAWLSMMRGDGEQSLAFADQAIELAEEASDELAAINALNTKGAVIYSEGDRTASPFLEEALVRAERGGYFFEEIRALVNATAAASRLRDLDRAHEFAQRSRDMAVQYENRQLEAFALALHSEVLHWKGNWGQAEDMASSVISSQPHTTATALWVLGRLQARQSRPEAGTTLDQAWAMAERTREMQNVLPTAAACAEHLWLTDQTNSDRIALFKGALHEAMQFQVIPWDLGDLAFWLWKLGELAETPKSIAEPYRLVIAGEYRRAADLCEDKGLPYEKGLALMHGDKKAQLEALDIFDALGATAVASKLRKTMRDQGMSVPRGKSRQSRDHAAGLTARQAEVLQLLDQGLSNAEIADRLFVSPRTVEHHVSAVLAKLDSTTRDEAVSSARERNLLTRTGPSRP